MCKIMVLSGVNDKTRDKAWPLIFGMSAEMSKTPNNDGLGYAMIDSDGVLASERWLRNHQAFRERPELSEFDKDLIDKFMGFVDKEPIYDQFGERDMRKLTSIIVHARNATSGREFFNTHPFVDVEAQTALIHNGTIRNVDELEYKQSSCDSEGILNAYIEKEVMKDPTNIQSAISMLDGSYACAVLSKDKDGIPIVDVFKNVFTELSGAVIEELQTEGGPTVMVFTTHLPDLERVCKELKYTIKTEVYCSAGVLLRMNALTGEVVTSVKFTPEYKAKEKGMKEYPKQNKLIIYKTWKDNKQTKQWCDYNNRTDYNRSQGVEKVEARTSSERFRERMSKADAISKWFRDGGVGVWKRRNDSSVA